MDRLTNSKAPSFVGSDPKKERKLPYSNDLEKENYQLREELKQLKRGLAASENEWMNMVGAELNEFKYRQFKANLQAHKKLVQMVAGVLANAKDGLTYEQCRHLAYEMEPEAQLYIGSGAAKRLKDDIQRLLGTHEVDDIEEELDQPNRLVEPLAKKIEDKRDEDPASI